jgi:hypothetical protein
MSKEACDLSPPSLDHNDDVARSSSIIVIDSDDRTPLYDATKVANHVLQQFFDDVHTDEDGIKSAKCLLCRMIIKQSTESTFNNKRHVERKHRSEMDRWQTALEMKKKVEGKKQPKVQQSFVRKSELSFEIHLFSSVCGFFRRSGI